MHAELRQHLKLGTWDLEHLPRDRKAIACKWVFRLKRDASGNIVKYKARLVVKGFSQISGIDFLETFAPTIRLETFRFLLALAARYGLRAHGLDVVGAYLNSPLNEVVYMLQPEGFDDGTGRVCRLKLSLYGLRQSAHNWNKTLDAAFKDLGFTRLISDQCVYVRRSSDGSPVIVSVHVDDMTLFARTDEELAQLKGELRSKFEVTDLGPLTHILGMEIQRDDDGSYHLHQTAYARRILESVGMDKSNPVSTPLDHNIKLTLPAENDPAVGDPEFCRQYRSGLGKLAYLAWATRPDLSHAIQHLSQFSQRPTPDHMSSLKRVYRYVQGTTTLGLHFKPNGRLITFSDADWANDATDRRSISGYLSLLADAPISWSSRKQPTVALSTMEAEFMALARATTEVLWLRELGSELGLAPDGPSSINVDNRSAIDFAQNSNSHARSKHIDIRYHFVRERITSNEVKLDHCASEDNLADILTKPLPKPAFVSLRDRFMSRS